MLICRNSAHIHTDFTHYYLRFCLCYSRYGIQQPHCLTYERVLRVVYLLAYLLLYTAYGYLYLLILVDHLCQYPALPLSQSTTLCALQLRLLPLHARPAKVTNLFPISLATGNRPQLQLATHSERITGNLPKLYVATLV